MRYAKRHHCTTNRTLKSQFGGTMSIAIGKRYTCSSCGCEIIVTKAGTGPLTCCAADMQIKEATPLPSSD